MSEPTLTAADLARWREAVLAVNGDYVLANKLELLALLDLAERGLRSVTREEAAERLTRSVLGQFVLDSGPVGSSMNRAMLLAALFDAPPAKEQP